MFPFTVIEAKAQESRISYLIIGGHAVNVYAEPRATLDVDLLVRQEDRNFWQRSLLAEGFQLHRDGGNFLQFSPPYGTSWRVDLILVNAATFDKLFAASRPASCFGLTLRVPSAEHLIALKLHAMVHGPADRYEKDFVDIVGIARNAALPPGSASLKEIFQRYGTPELYEKFKQRLAPG